MASAADVDWSAHGNWPGSADDAPGPDTGDTPMPDVSKQGSTDIIIVGTDIVKVGDTLPSNAEWTVHLDDLEASGDTQALNEIASQAWGYQEYAAQQQAAERVNYFGRLKVMAEARIGAIDLDLHPGMSKSALQFGDKVVAPVTRSQWRLLGCGLKTGQLDRAMGIAERGRDGVYTTHVAAELRQMGVSYVHAAPLLKRYRELCEQNGLSLAEVARRAGVSVQSFLARPGTRPAHDKVSRASAMRVAAVLGVDASALQSVKKYRKPLERKRVRRARKLKGGRLDETYALIRKAMQELDRATEGTYRWGTDETWAHLDAAEQSIGRALRRAPIK